MPAYMGSSLYVAWIYSGGTVALAGDFRTCTYTPSVNLVQETAGADAAASYLAGAKDGAISMTIVQQASGTALFTALAEGTSGTVIIAPEGTASGKQKMTIPAISQGCPWSQPYDNIVELSPAWQQNGARTDGAY